MAGSCSVRISGSARDFMTGEVVANGERRSIVVEGSDRHRFSPTALAIPEIGIRADVGDVSLGLGVQGVVGLSGGASLEGRTIAITRDCPDPNAPNDVGCTPTGARVPSEQVSGLMVSIVPVATLGYDF